MTTFVQPRDGNETSLLDDGIAVADIVESLDAIDAFYAVYPEADFVLDESDALTPDEERVWSQIAAMIRGGTPIEAIRHAIDTMPEVMEHRA